MNRTPSRWWLSLPLTIASVLPGCSCGLPSLPGGLGGIVGTNPRRHWLVQDWDEPDGFAVYGYVVFPQQAPPQTEQQARRLAFCQAFVTGLQPVYGGEDPKKVFVTQWAVTHEPHPWECEAPVEDYDAERMLPLVDCLKLHGREGPVLVAQPRSGGFSDAHPRLILDLSSVPASEFKVPVRRWVSFTRDLPFRNALGEHASNAWAAITAYVSQGTFQVGQVSWVDGCN